MSDILFAALIVFLAANPPAASRFWRRTSRVSIGINRAMWSLIVVGLAVAAALLVGLLADEIIDLLGVSLPTFQIGAGSLLLLGVVPVFVPDHETSQDAPETILWPALRLFLWLASPSVLFAVVALAAQRGMTDVLIGVVVGLLGGAIVLIAAVRFESEPVNRIVTWLSWLMAAVLLVLAADMIRQGVQTV